jgi:hypothetical protein
MLAGVIRPLWGDRKLKLVLKLSAKALEET